MTSGTRLTVRRICSIWAALKAFDGPGPRRPRLTMSRIGHPSVGARKGRLPTLRLPTDERPSGELLSSLLQRRYGGPCATHRLPDVLERRAAQCRITGRLGEEGAKDSQDGNALLERLELARRERW